MGCWRYTYIKKSFIIKDNLGSGTDFPVFCWKKKCRLSNKKSLKYLEPTNIQTDINNFLLSFSLPLPLWSLSEL
jgi:hypothetical protein